MSITVSVVVPGQDRWDGRDMYGGPKGPSPALHDYAQAEALSRFARDELRSSERAALAESVTTSVTEALPEFRALADKAVDAAVTAFLKTHSEARAALKTD